MGRLLFLSMLSFVIVFGAACSGSGGGKESGTESNELISYISHGESVDIDAKVPKSGLVVVEFTADW